jgi:hypothetical protein
VIVWLALFGSHAYAETIAMLPLDGEKRLELYGQPVAAEIARALKAAGLDVVVVGASMDVPDRANLIVDGTIKAAKSKQVEVSIRIRDPRDGTVLENLPAAPTKLDNLDKAAADLSARVVPLVKQHLTTMAKPAVVEVKPAEPTPVLPTKPVTATADPTLTTIVAPTMSPTLAPLRTALEHEAAAWAAAQRRQATVTFEVVDYAQQPGKVPMASARVRVKIDNGSGVRFNRVVRTDTVVGDRDATPDALAARTAREVLSIVTPHFRRTMAMTR